MQPFNDWAPGSAASMASGVWSFWVTQGRARSSLPTSRSKVIEGFKKSVDGKIPIIAGITLEGTKVAALEAKRAVEAGAEAGLVYPSHGWLRFSYQKGAPQNRYRAIYEESGLPLILFQYPDATHATYNLETQLEIAAQPGVFAMKNGVRNMRRWDTEIPVIRRERPNLQIYTCHDEYLLHTMFDVDGALVGYGNIAPEPLLEMIAAGKAKDYAKARAVHDRLLLVTKSVYHRGSHMEGSVALKWALVARGILEHATVRSPLLPLEPGARRRNRECNEEGRAGSRSLVVGRTSRGARQHGRTHEVPIRTCGVYRRSRMPRWAAAPPEEARVGAHVLPRPRCACQRSHRASGLPGFARSRTAPRSRNNRCSLAISVIARPEADFEQAASRRSA